MPYDPNNPKTSTFFIMPRTQIDTSTFLNELTALRNLTQFYGTDQSGIQADYKTTLSHAMKNRIKEPFAKNWHHRQAFFLKPYYTGTEKFAATIGSLSPPLTIILSALGLLGNPILYIALSCLPALLELISAIVSLGQCVYFNCKSLLTSNPTDRIKASEYLKDAITRFVLVIPLAAVSLISFPIDFIRFITRMTSTIVQATNNRHAPVHAIIPQAEPEAEPPVAGIAYV